MASATLGVRPFLSSLIATSRRRPGGRRRRVYIAVGSIVVLLLLAVIIDSALYYGKVHAGVSVAGRGLGGLTHDEATAFLARMVRESNNSTVVLRSGSKSWTVTPADLGMTIDTPAAVVAAMDVSRRSNFLVDLGRRCRLYFKGEEVSLSGTFDDALLDELFTKIARDLDIPPVEAGLFIDGGRITVIEGLKGLVVDKAALAEELRAALLALQPGELQVPMAVADPSLRVDETQHAVEQAEVMISAPVTLSR